MVLYQSSCIVSQFCEPGYSASRLRIHHVAMASYVASYFKLLANTVASYNYSYKLSCTLHEVAM